MFKQGQIVDLGKYGKAVIKEYINSNNVLIKFLDKYGYETWTYNGNLRRKAVKNPYAPLHYNIGIFGTEYPSKDENNVKTKEYQVWHDMLFRLTDKFKKNNRTYQDVTICDEWTFYPNFHKWIIKQKNYNKWKQGKHWCLDKDILIKHNKIYSPDTCVLVPNNVNTLFVKKDANRGNLPIGVTPNHKRFMACYSDPVIGNTRMYAGTFDTPEEAFYAYKEAKENVIRKVAEIEYKQNNITKRCYDAMLRYEVEITD